MICNRCQKEPKARGIRRAKCKYCKGEFTSYVVPALNTCMDCSVIREVCQLCGIQMVMPLKLLTPSKEQ
jgi:hypothetical protein